MTPRASLAVWARIYQSLLVLLPRNFRTAASLEMRETFGDCYRAKLRAGGRPAAFSFAFRACVRLVICAAQMRISTRATPPGLGNPHPGQRGLMPFMAQDVRGALRAVVRAPGFHVTAICIMALGIGASTAVFTVVDRVLIRSLPYEAADRLVYFSNPTHSVPDFKDWQSHTTTFDQLVATRVLNYDLTSEGAPRRLRTAIVSDGFFAMFGARPFLGTLFSRSDRTTTQPVVISEQLWRDLWGADAAIVGQRIILNGQPVVVSGVMDESFLHPEALISRRVDAWLPLDLHDPSLQHRGMFILSAAGRLKTSATLDAAQTELNALAELLATEYPERYRREDGSARAKRLVPLYEATVTDVAGTLQMLMGAVVLMLLIACANVANLLLARGMDRRREIALRIALGAGARRILVQLLTETVVLASVGGVLGVGLALVGIRWFVQTNAIYIPRVADATVDIRVLAFAIAVSVATGIAFGILPALHGSRSDAAAVMKESTSRISATRGKRRIRTALVIAEVALALILVTGATVLFNNMVALHRIDPGFQIDNLTTVTIGLSSKTPEERAQFSHDVIERIHSIPGVTAVGAGVTIPFAVTGGGRCCWFMDFGIPSKGRSPEAAVVHPVTEHYFAALGATIIRGRMVTDRDSGVDPVPAVINATMANRLFGDEEPVGQLIDMEGTPISVVGIVGDIRHWGLEQPIDNEVYFTFDGQGEHFFRYYLAIRSSVETSGIAPAIREAIWSVDPDIPLDAVSSMSQRVTDSVASSRFYTHLMAGFALLALALAGGGIYSSMLYAVGQQVPELGVRMAIGANPRDIAKLVLSRAAATTSIGLALGVLGARWLDQTLQHLVVGVSASDPRPLAAATVLLGTVATIASYVPARRAACTDPIRTLRTD